MVRSQSSTGPNRRLSDRLAHTAAGFPEVHNGVNRVTVTLRDGSAVSGVLLAGGAEIISVEGLTEVPFQAREIAEVDDASGLAEGAG